MRRRPFFKSSAGSIAALAGVSACERENTELISGVPVVASVGDRKGVFDIHHYRNVDVFHNPRHLMMNLLALDRMIKLKGEISSFWGIEKTFNRIVYFGRNMCRK